MQALTGGFGPDVVIDAVGRPETYQQAFYGRDLAGTVVLVGVPTPTMQLELPLLDVFGRGGSLKSSWYGDCLPDRDFPMLIDLYLQGRLPLDAFVSEEIGIDDIEAAFDKMHGGRRAALGRDHGPGIVTARIDYTVTSGTFSLDGETFDVENNVWIVGDDAECVIIDAPHDVAAITRGWWADGPCGACVCTHAHDDHVRVAPALGAAVGAPVLLHPDDLPVWRLTHAGRRTANSPTGSRSRSPASRCEVIHTPGHAPGAVCLYSPDLGVVFTGDTLFNGGPGATGRVFSDKPT